MITNIITNNDIVQSHTDNAIPEMPMKEGTKSETSAYSIDDNIEKYTGQREAPTGSTADFIQKFKEAYTSNTPREDIMNIAIYRDWETDRKSTRLNSSHITRSRMPSSA